ncbi:MAG: hypothetical protein SPF89_04710 [Sphaerochaetaceae bacterium]|nr:hypothetical protein [Spirochaetales bacterium]MDY5499387.1 hypothetical protein [Sphaerochaetaceae bacterium]
MRVALFFCALVLPLVPIGASGATIALGLDAMAVRALWSEELSLRLEAVAGCGERFAFRFPLSFSYRLTGAEVSALEWGLMVDYHPFPSGFFLSLGMFQSAYLFGPDKPQEDHLYLHEIAVGWTLRVAPFCLVEPKIVIFDPTGVFASESALWRQAVGDRPDVRLSLLVGLELPAPWPVWEERNWE